MYTEPVKYTGFKVKWAISMSFQASNFFCIQGDKHTIAEMFSLSENLTKKAIKKSPSEFMRFNEKHLSRVYPSAKRINSANYNPAHYWMHGCQMVALNYQANGD